MTKDELKIEFQQVQKILISEVARGIKGVSPDMLRDLMEEFLSLRAEMEEK